MSRKSESGEDLEFPTSVKEQAFRLNQERAPRGCVGYYCEWCYFSNTQRRYFHVDHLVPASRLKEFGMTVTELTSLKNACVLCEGCNASKLNFNFPRLGVGLAFRAPNLNMTHGERRQSALDWDQLVMMAMRKGPYRRAE